MWSLRLRVGFIVDAGVSALGAGPELGFLLFQTSRDMSSLSGKPCTKGRGGKHLHQPHSYAQLLVRFF